MVTRSDKRITRCVTHDVFIEIVHTRNGYTYTRDSPCRKWVYTHTHYNQMYDTEIAQYLEYCRDSNYNHCSTIYRFFFFSWRLDDWLFESFRCPCTVVTACWQICLLLVPPSVVVTSLQHSWSLREAGIKITAKMQTSWNIAPINKPIWTALSSTLFSVESSNLSSSSTSSIFSHIDLQND